MPNKKHKSKQSVKKKSNKKSLDLIKLPKQTSKTTKQNLNKTKTNLKQETVLLIKAFAFLALSLISLMKLGFVGEILNNALRCIVGDLNILLLVILIIVSIYEIFKRKQPKLDAETMISINLVVTAITLLVSIPSNKNSGFVVFKEYIKLLPKVFEESQLIGYGHGGIIGAFVYSLFSALFSPIGVYVIILLSFVAAGVIYFKPDEEKVKETVKKEESIKKEFKMPTFNAKDLLENKVLNKTENKAKEVEKTIKDTNIEDKVDEKMETKKLELPKAKISENKQTVEIKKVNSLSLDVEKVCEEKPKYKLPSLNLLTSQKTKVNSSNNKKAAVEAGVKLIEVLNEFGINARLMETHIGPSVTRFEVKPDSGIKVSKISALQNDIKLALAAKDIRIEAPIPSKSAVGIEIPNIDKTIVGLKEMLKEVPEKYANSKLLFAIGRNLSGEPIYGEIDKLIHLGVFGSTGSGKSSGINSLLVSLIMRTKPEEVKLLLIDPKKVEFTPYSEVPHLIGPIITDPHEASNALKVIIEEMDRRYELFANAGVRNIKGYNQKTIENQEENLVKLPYIVVIIDELADLMLVAAKEVEASIQRITQLARAAGIHLVLATQRPSVDVLTGVIKANIPSRIAYAVSSAVDSRTMIDQQGAERLLGAGDMLYLPTGSSSPVRLQGSFVSDEEVEAVCQYVSAQQRPQFDEAFIRLQMIKDTVGFAGGEVDDSLYEEAKEFVIESQKASTSFLQRKFSIGYQRAARLIDLMEDNGVVGPARGSKPREVYMKKTNTVSDDINHEEEY